MKRNDFSLNNYNANDFLQQLKKAIKNSGPLQQAAKTLVGHIMSARENNPNSSEGEDVLSLLVHEAQIGTEIDKRFPGGYKLLLQNEELRKAFLQILELQVKDDQGGLTPLPAPASVNLKFLEEMRPSTQIEIIMKHTWKISWGKTIEQLRMVFMPPATGEVYRSIPDLVEDPVIILLRDEFKIEDVSLAIVLEGTITEIDPDVLAVAISVAVSDMETHEDIEDMQISALLVWGSYQNEVRISDQGRGEFSPIPFEAFLDEKKENIAANLALTLNTRPS